MHCLWLCSLSSTEKPATLACVVFGDKAQSFSGRKKKRKKKKVENLHLRNTDRLENQKKGRKERQTHGGAKYKGRKDREEKKKEAVSWNISTH